ncbi:MAG: DNA-directed RNA polymerase subunit omega [Syntrophobacter sp.]
MARVTVEDCLRNVDSRFTLVHLAVRRVLQLRGGMPLIMENSKGNKEVVMALREIASGSVTVDNIRQIEESRPVFVEPPAPVIDAAATADLKEILEEATSFSASEYEGDDQITEEELDRGVERGGEEE